jgi:glycosyltransferase involved in cell wall biosynthesis
MNILMLFDVFRGSTAFRPRSRPSAGVWRRWVMPPVDRTDYAAPAPDDAGIMRIPSRYLFLDPEDRILKAREILAQEKPLRRRQFDLLHIQTPFIAHHVGVKLARRLGIPVVETYHTYFEEYLYHYIPFLPKRWRSPWPGADPAAVQSLEAVVAVTRHA